MPAAVTYTEWPAPSPPDATHTTDDVDTHDAVVQLLTPILAEAVVVLAPKLSPNTVTL